MRTIRYTRRFKRDYRREQSGGLGKRLDKLLMEAVNLLAADLPLPPRYADHPLAGEWNDHRDCHIRPDLVLIYRKPGPDTLELVRLGSHSELGLQVRFSGRAYAFISPAQMPSGIAGPPLLCTKTEEAKMRSRNPGYKLNSEQVRCPIL
jgi:mRNA interferase YafQ